MASIEKRGQKYRAVFRYGGEKYSGSLNTSSEKKATIAKSQIERNLELVSLGVLEVPPDCDVFDFFLTGKRPSANGATPDPSQPKSKRLTFKKLFDLYFGNFLKESIEENSFKMLQTHRNNLERIIGKNSKVHDFSSSGIQSYIDQRAKEKGRRGTIKPVTIRKEITTLSTVFDWAVTNGFIEKVPNKKGIRYPKGKEKLPFQTWEEIERKIGRGGLDENEIAELWECLFLNTEQIHDLLAHVRQNARHEFIYPSFAFAAHTGARRSEIARSQLSDVDFDSKIITIRELKRVRGMQSTRRVPISPFLNSVLRKWLNNHPGGQMTFCMPAKPLASNNQIAKKLTNDQMQNHFVNTLSGSKWEVMHGWHVLRHSFCSNCAATGVEQRVINDWVGHQTEEMVRRYRHLFPNKQQQAIQCVFGG